MPNNTAFLSYIKGQLADPEFQKEFAEAYEKTMPIRFVDNLLQ